MQLPKTLLHTTLQPENSVALDFKLKKNYGTIWDLLFVFLSRNRLQNHDLPNSARQQEILYEKIVRMLYE